MNKIYKRLEDLTYFLLCVPDTRAMQEAVDKILKENKDKILISHNFSLSPSYYFNRETKFFGRKGTFYIVELWLAEEKNNEG